jgi:hypothetical protein
MTPGPGDDQTADESGGSTRKVTSHTTENDESRQTPADGDSPQSERSRPEDPSGTEAEYRTPAVEESEQAGDWKFSLDSLSNDSEDGEGNITGKLDRDQPLEPGNIDPENAFFVALGILIVVGLIAGAMFGF